MNMDIDVDMDAEFKQWLNLGITMPEMLGPPDLTRTYREWLTEYPQGIVSQFE